MDDSSKNKTQNVAQSQNPNTQSGSITLSDLYGPSNAQTLPTQPTNPLQPPQMSLTPPPSKDIPNPVLTANTGVPPPNPNAPLADSVAPMGSSEEELKRKKRKKIIFIVIGVILFLIILVVGIFASTRSSGSASGQAKLTFWGLWEENKTMQVIINDFEKEYPNIKVEYTKQDSKKYKERLTARITNNTGPDIYTIHNTWLPTIQQFIAPLSKDVIKADEFMNTYYPVMQKDLSKNGAIYALPQGIDTLALFVNTEILNAAGVNVPQTWDEFIKASKTLTIKETDGKTIKTAGAALGTYDNITHAPDVISMLMVQNGIDLDKYETSQNLIAEALQFYTSFKNSKENVWDETLNPSLLAFSNGEVAMYFGYSWDIFDIKAKNPDLSFTIHPVPSLPSRKATIASYWATGVSTKSKSQREAMIFMKYLNRKEVIQKLYTESSKTRLFGQPYARKDLAPTLSSNPLVFPFVQQGEVAQSTFFSSDTNDATYNDRLNAYLGNAVREATSGSSTETAVETLLQGIKQVRSQYNAD